MIRGLQVLTLGMCCVSAFPAGGQVADGTPTDGIRNPDGGTRSGMTRLLDEAVRKLAIQRNQEALDRLEQKDYPGALTLLKQASDLDSENSEIANNLGYIYYLLGNTDEAEHHLRHSLELDPERFVAYLNLADMLGKEGESNKRLKEAARLLAKAREVHGNKPRVILRQARVARLLGELQVAMRFYREYVANRKPTDKLLIEIGDFYREMGKDEEAFGWYQQVTNSNEWGNEAATRIWDIEVERQAKKYGWSARVDEIPEKAVRLTERGQSLLGQKQYVDAKRLFEEAIKLAPGYALVRIHLGDLLMADGRSADAEVAYLRALALDSGNADIYVRLGKLYLQSKRDTRYTDATLFLRRALDLRPDWTALHLMLAKALQGTGDLDRALRHLEIFLAGTPSGDSRQEARRLKKTIEKLLGGSRGGSKVLALDDNLFGNEHGLSEKLLNALNRARAHLARGRPDAAMAELRRLPENQQDTLVLNLEGRILHASGRLKEAVRVLRKSIGLEPKQPSVHEQLGNLTEELGQFREARYYYKKSESLRNPVAKFFIVRLDMANQNDGVFAFWDDLTELEMLLGARNRIDDFISSGKGALYHDEALAIRDDIQKRLWRLIAISGGALLLLGVTILFGTRRLWGGVGLNTLLTKYPDSGPEVQRVLSAIRHEVLKHNTMALGGVIESLDKGAPDAMEKMRHFRNTLLGKNDNVPKRLEKYATELRKIGLSFGLRLNLKQKEPVIRLLHRGFGLLVRALKGIEGESHLAGAKKRRLLRSLRQAFRLLNVDGYEAVQQMLGRIRMLEVDEPMIRNIAVRVLREPGFADINVAPFAIDSSLSWPITVLISQRAFEDIFANLIRNALQSSVEMGLSPVEVGMILDLEVDEVTGFERVVFLVCDQAKKKLTTAMIRKQAIEGGLGITADLVSRYDGMVDVAENVRGWRKAVRVKLPMAPVIEESKVS